MEWTYEGVMKIAMEGVDENRLNNGSDDEVRKFRMNVGKMMQALFSEPPEEKVKGLQVLKAAAFGFTPLEKATDKVGDKPHLNVDCVSISPSVKTVRGRRSLTGFIGQLPVITPVITAMLQVVTGDDLGGKIDAGFKRMDDSFKRAEQRAEQRHREMDERAEQRHGEVLEMMKTSHQQHQDIVELLKKGFGVATTKAITAPGSTPEVAPAL